MMSPDRGLNEEQRMMRQTCRKYVDDHVIPFIRENWQREWQMDPTDRLPAKILEEADKCGIRTLGIPEEFGGTETDPATEAQTFAILCEEVARGDSGLADKLSQNWKITRLLRNFAPRHIQEKWFPRIVADPQFLLATAATEPRGASDRWLPYETPGTALQTRAVLDGDFWVINGRKQFISNGYDASLYVVVVNTKRGATMSEGSSALIVPRDTPGLNVVRCNETLGGRFMNNGEIEFIDCRIPRDHLMAEPDQFFKQFPIYLRPGKIVQAAKNLGVGMAAFERTVEYCETYVQGGQILIKHQAVARRIADMATKLSATRALLREAAIAVDENAPNQDALCNMAKVFASEEILKVVQHGMELHGGNGSMLEFGYEKLFRDASIFLHMDSTVDITHFKIVKAMFPHTAGKYAGPEA
ncbi:MAG: acyl-CoA/acyl-ACP dehydrogenase [Glaciimonas sp.]|nr:acyl-CoA/acyl-ACP dehydrogenase [Glaciimonas sp.]